MATGLASVGLAAGGTGGALLATGIAGTGAVAGLPFGLVVVGSAAGAVLLSWLTVRIGRPRALAIGYLIGVVGGGVVLAGDLAASLGLVLLGSLLLGPANASVFLGRYAGAELVAEGIRGRAMGVLLFATAVGAIIAPNLLGPAGIVALWLGLAEASGLYLIAVAVFGIGAVLLSRVRPMVDTLDRDPLDVPISATMARERRLMALLVLGLANLAMVGIMAVAPVHYHAIGHDYAFIGLAISLHVAGMFGPSPLTGWLCDRYAPARVAAAGGALLLLAGIWGAIIDQVQAMPAAGFLLVLGLGWNLAVVAGSAMLTADTAPRLRPRAEASGEVVMGLGAGLGASIAGVVAAIAGWPVIALAAGSVGALVAVALVANSWDDHMGVYRARSAHPDSEGPTPMAGMGKHPG